MIYGSYCGVYNIVLNDVPKTDMKLILLLSLTLSLLAVTVDSLSDLSVPDMFFPFGTDEGDSVVPVGDDTSSPAVNILIEFPFLYGKYSRLYVRRPIKVHLLS